MEQNFEIYSTPQVDTVELINEGTLLITSGIGAGGGTEEDEWG